MSSFQAGVDTLYNKCVSCGSTPSTKTPAAISISIETIYINRYNEGYDAGHNGSVIDLGTGQSFDVTGYSGYLNFTLNNFICELAVDQSRVNASVGDGNGNAGAYSIDKLKKSYSNGILTAYHENYLWVGQQQWGAGSGTVKSDVHVYLIL